LRYTFELGRFNFEPQNIMHPIILPITADFFQQVIRLQQGEGSPLHFHRKVHETYFVLQGEGTIQVDTEIYHVKTMDFMDIPPGTHHKIKNNKSALFVVLSTKSSREQDFEEVEET